MNKAVKTFFEVYENYDLTKYMCLICGSRENIHEHHIDYINNFTVPLCASCHIRLHSNKIKGTNIPAPRNPIPRWSESYRSAFITYAKKDMESWI